MKVVEFCWDELDLAWVTVDFDDVGFLPFDLDRVLYKVACIQTHILFKVRNLCRDIFNLITLFAQERLTVNDQSSEDDELPWRIWRIKHKPKYMLRS
jgi:hypothetical protein